MTPRLETTHPHDASLGANRFARGSVIDRFVAWVASASFRRRASAVRTVTAAVGLAGSVVAGVHVAVVAGTYIRSYAHLKNQKLSPCNFWKIYLSNSPRGRTRSCKRARKRSLHSSVRSPRSRYKSRGPCSYRLCTLDCTWARK